MWRLRNGMRPSEPWFVPQRDMLTWTRPPHKKRCAPGEREAAGTARTEAGEEADGSGGEPDCADRAERAEAAEPPCAAAPAPPARPEQLDEWSPYPFGHPKRRATGPLPPARPRHETHPCPRGADPLVPGGALRDPIDRPAFISPAATCPTPEGATTVMNHEQRIPCGATLQLTPDSRPRSSPFPSRAGAMSARRPVQSPSPSTGGPPVPRQRPHDRIARIAEKGPPRTDSVDPTSTQPHARPATSPTTPAPRISPPGPPGRHRRSNTAVDHARTQPATACGPSRPRGCSHEHRGTSCLRDSCGSPPATHLPRIAADRSPPRCPTTHTSTPSAIRSSTDALARSTRAGPGPSSTVR